MLVKCPHSIGHLLYFTYTSPTTVSYLISFRSFVLMVVFFVFSCCSYFRSNIQDCELLTKCWESVRWEGPGHVVPSTSCLQGAGVKHIITASLSHEERFVFQHQSFTFSQQIHRQKGPGEPLCWVVQFFSMLLSSTTLCQYNDLLITTGDGKFRRCLTWYSFTRHCVRKAYSELLSRSCDESVNQRFSVIHIFGGASVAVSWYHPY